MRQRHIARRASGSVWLLVYCAALSLLLACAPDGPDAPFADYLQHLGAALSATPPEIRPTRTPLPPPIDGLQLAIPASDTDELDFLQLSGCAVQANIGKRQTILGQSAKPSQRLLLELEYLRLAPPCITLMGNNNKQALAVLLTQAWQEKQAQLPLLIFNATLGSNEYRSFWLPFPPPGEYPRGSPAQATAAVEAINRQIQLWIRGDYRAHNRDFELLLSDVAGGSGGAQLQEWTRQTDWLATASHLVERRLASGSPCAKPERNTTRLIAKAYTAFTDVIQPRLQRAQHAYDKITAPIAALETQLNTTLPQPYRHWMEDREQRRAALAAASEEHLRLLNRLRQACSTE